MIAEAAGHIEVANSFVATFSKVILFPLIALLTGVALLLFLWGSFMFIYNADNETARETGKRHMLYGIIGLVVMLSAYSILKIAAGTFGLPA